MRLSCSFLLLALFAPSAAAVAGRLRSANRAGGGQRSLASSAVAGKSGSKKKTGLGRFARAAARRSRSALVEELEAPPSERRYWMSEWVSVESELLQFGAALGGQRRKVRPTGASEVRLTGGVAGSAKATAATTATPAAAKQEEVKEGASGVSKSGAPETAALVPMLGMLKGVYEDAKARIGKLNAQEKQSREKFEENEAAHKRKMADIEAAHRKRAERAAAAQRLGHAQSGVNATDSAAAGEAANATAAAGFRDELYANETHWEEHLFAYRQRGRDRQHRQYHNMLKLTHAAMEKEKRMIETYEAAISTAGKKKASEPNTPEMRKIEQTIKEMPEVVLLQQQQGETLGFVEDSLQMVRKAIRSFS